MTSPFTILFYSFVKPFYRENAGSFILFFVVMFGIIGKVDGAGIFEYHYSLIIGMLKNSGFLLLVFFLWFLYARKYAAFVSNVLSKPPYSFLHIYSTLQKADQFRLFVMVEVLLLMPVLIYSAFIIYIGLHQHHYLAAGIVSVYLLLLCVVPAVWHVYSVNNPGINQLTSWQGINVWSRLSSSYFLLLIRFVNARQKLFWAATKLFTCGILYLVARNNTPGDTDTSFVFLFFDFGILAHGVLVYRIRDFEETYLVFYRSAPVSLYMRFVQYALVYLLLLIPEMITAALLVPDHLHYADAISVVLSAYVVLLLMNSITFLADISMKQFVKILFLIFCVQIISLLVVGLTPLYVASFILSFVFFKKGYYMFERNMQSDT